MLYKELFSILAKVDSTNNYAMGQVHEGLATHGMAWFALDQTAGKGQRGRSWKSTPGSALILSVVIQPPAGVIPGDFTLPATIALAVLKFCKAFGGDEWSLKWPNDIYWRDRKAGGILIENLIRGSRWHWAVIGVGINVNQEEFDPELPNPVSMRMITGKDYDVIKLGQELHLSLMKAIDAPAKEIKHGIIEEYNQVLFKKGEWVVLEKNEKVFNAKVEGVDGNGNLLTSEGAFRWGEISWK